MVPAAAAWAHFASDRSHMALPGGGWSAPPPPWPCFVAASDGCANRLQAYLAVGGGGGSDDSGGSGDSSGGSRGGSSSDEDDGGGRGGGGAETGAAARAAAAAAAGAPDLGTVLSEPRMLARFLQPPRAQGAAPPQA